MIEIALRMAGFGKMPLYSESDEWEYMMSPNQSGYRLGNRYYINAYGMRSDEVDATKQHVLGLGDSVIFGGAQTDQDSIATSIFTQDTGIQMLNISAGSWGPDNCVAYLRHFGLFDAKAVFLVVSSHDAYDNIDHQPVVGVHVSYPKSQYCCAIAEVVSRYVIPRYFPTALQDPDQQVVVGSGIAKNGKVFNTGFDNLKEMCDSAHIPLYVYLHATTEELAAGKYDNQGVDIISWCSKNDVNLINELDYHFTEQDYRDIIHPNARGQRKIADIMKKTFSESEGKL